MKNSPIKPQNPKQASASAKPPLPQGLRLYSLYMFIWLIIGGLMFNHLAKTIIWASAVHAEGNGVAVALGAMATRLVWLSNWVIVHLGLAAVVCGAAVRRGPTALTLMKIVSVYLLISAVALGFGLPLADRHLRLVTGISERANDLVEVLQCLLPALVALKAAACLYLFRSETLRRAFGLEPKRPPEPEPRLALTLIAALLIMVIYKDAQALSLWVLSPFFKFFLYDLKSLALSLVLAGSLAAAIVGLRALKSEASGSGLLPACLGLISLSRLVFLGFYLFIIVTPPQSHQLEVLILKGSLNFLEAAACACLLYHVLARRREMAGYHDFPSMNNVTQGLTPRPRPESR